ncbi:hypothetical protein GCM10010245_03790 [Streptomyces spectabilis]|nr:hypothetical protein GCM10010245_03790 [Streptomyces spectabilis]
MPKGSQLTAFLESLHWSLERLAREINRRYGEGTVSLKAPYGWAKGAYPRGRVPEFVAAVLSEHLGRSIDISQIWPEQFPDPEPGGTGDPALGPPWSEEHVELLLRPLVEQDEHDGAEPKGRYRPMPGAALVSLAVDWLTASQTLASGRTEGAELSTEMVDMLIGRIARLRKLSSAQNGDLALHWVVHELRWTLHLTRKAAYDARTGRRLYGAMAELSQLAGWLSEKQGRHTESQQYLLAALRASGLAGDRNMGAYVLSCLSRHLTKCGNGQDAIRLIKLAGIGSDRTLPGVLCPMPAPWGTRGQLRLGDEPTALLAEEPGGEPRVPRQATRPPVPVTDPGSRTVA